MALETLKDLTEVDGFSVGRTIEGADYIFIDDDANIILFEIQNGPIKEKGVNGCQVDQIIHVAKLMIEGLDKKFPCQENKGAIASLEGALLWLDKRKNNREARGVEGTSLS